MERLSPQGALFSVGRQAWANTVSLTWAKGPAHEEVRAPVPPPTPALGPHITLALTPRATDPSTSLPHGPKERGPLTCGGKLIGGPHLRGQRPLVSKRGDERQGVGFRGGLPRSPSLGSPGVTGLPTYDPLTVGICPRNLPSEPFPARVEEPGMWHSSWSPIPSRFISLPFLNSPFTSSPNHQTPR